MKEEKLEQGSEKRKTVYEVEEDKRKQEKFLRMLWKTCFGDSKAYEDFYFQTVYLQNKVYTIEDKGMLHLNPYLCRIGKHTEVLNYIVGVATKENCRRQGIMRRLLFGALKDMYMSKKPFTYLMPADTRYYEPFSFVSVCSGNKEKIMGSSCKTDDIIFADYRQLKAALSEEEWEVLLCRIAEWLDGRFYVFAEHNRKYFDLMCAEKTCQEGAVIFCFQKEKGPAKASVHGQFLGFFAYGKDGGDVAVEQYVLSEEDPALARHMIKQLVSYYFEETQPVTIVHHFPYMVRIVNALSCMEIFSDCFREFASNNQTIQLTDSVLTENSGAYLFYLEEGHVMISKSEYTGLSEEYPAQSLETVCMTVEELAEYIFCQREGKNVFFAEVV